MSIQRVGNQNPNVVITSGESASTPSPDSSSTLTIQAGTEGQVSLTSDASAFPSPTESANRLEAQYQKLQALLVQIDQLASMGNAAARQIKPQIEQALAAIDQVRSSDIDSDGLFDLIDPDRDGDAITNEAESARGLNPNSNDTDGDTMTDDFEIRGRNFIELLKQRGIEVDPQVAKRFDPLQSDGDHNNIMDNVEIPERIRADLGMGEASSATTSSQSVATIASGLSITTGEDDYSSSTGSSGSSQNRLEIGMTPGGATQLIPEDVSRLVIRVPEGDQNTVHLREVGGELQIELENPQGTQVIRIPDWRQKVIQLEGQGTVIAHNVDLPEPQENGYGGYQTAFQIGEGFEVQDILSPVEGIVPETRTVDGVQELTLDLNETNLPTGETLPLELIGTLNGETLTKYTVNRSGNDLVFEGTNREGETKIRMIVKEGFTKMGQIEVKLTRGIGGQWFESDVSGFKAVHGTDENDFIDLYGSGEVKIFGEGGDDFLRANGSGASEIDGGEGNDTIVGGEGDDSLLGGDGNDIMFGRGGTNSLSGGRGNDSMISQYTAAGTGIHEVHSGDEGYDISNSPFGENFSVERSIQDLDQLRNQLSRYLGDETASAIERGEMLRAETHEIQFALELAANEAHQLSIDWLMQKEAQAKTPYGPEISGTPVEPPADTAAGTPTSPPLDDNSGGGYGFPV